MDTWTHDTKLLKKKYYKKVLPYITALKYSYCSTKKASGSFNTGTLTNTTKNVLKSFSDVKM